MSKRTRDTNLSAKAQKPASAASSVSSAPTRTSRSRATASNSATTSAVAAQTSASSERKRGRSTSTTESRKRAKSVKKEEKSDSDSASDEAAADPAPAARGRQPAPRAPAAAAAVAAASSVPAAAAVGAVEVDNDAPASGDSSALRSWALQHLPGSSRKSPWPGHDDLAVDDKTYAYLSAVGVVPMTFGVKLPDSNAHVLERYTYAVPMGYGLGKSGWVGFKPSIDEMPTMRQIKKWVLESYHAQAKKTRIKQLEAAMRQ